MGQKKQQQVVQKKKNWLLRFVFATILLLASTGALCYYAWNLRLDHLASSSRATVCETQLDERKASSATLSADLEACQEAKDNHASREKAQAESLEAMAQNLDATKSELTVLRKQREETAKRLAAFRSLTEKFRKMIDSGKLDVVVRNGRMMLKLPAGVLFPSGSADLSRDGELTLMEVAVVLRDMEDRTLLVTGHTDNRPVEDAASKSKYATNWELSAARAVNVTKFLIESRLDPKNLIAAGHAQYDPVGDNTTADGRQANRRIEIALLPKIEELPPMPTE